MKDQLVDLDFKNENTAINLLDPTLAQDAATKNYVDSVAIAGTKALFIQTASVTVGNTTTETTLIGAGAGSVTLPANFFSSTGKTARVTITGYYSRTSGSQTWRFKIGGTTIITMLASINGTNVLWSLDLIITCRATGVTGTVQVQPTNASVNTTIVSSVARTTTSTINTTVSQTLDITVQNSIAAVGNRVTATNVIIQPLTT